MFFGGVSGDKRDYICLLTPGRLWFDGLSGAAYAGVLISLLLTRQGVSISAPAVQKRGDKNKLYSLHEAHIYCMSEGKAHSNNEIGGKASITTTRDSGIIIGALMR